MPYNNLQNDKNQQENKMKKEQFYKNVVNIGIFIFIGILIIFLCDQITEIAIQIGMKRTTMLLEKYLILEKDI